MKREFKGWVWVLAVLMVWVGVASAEVIRGKVTTIDLKANRIAVEAEGQSRNFTFEPQDFIVWKGDDEVKAEEITEGAEAEVGYYTDETGLEIASWVDLTPLEGEEMISVPGEELTTVPAEETLGVTE